MIPRSSPSCQRSWPIISSIPLPLRFRPTVANRIGDTNRLKRFFHVVSANDTSAAKHGGHGGGDAAFQSPIRFRPKGFPDKCFTGRTHEERLSEYSKGRQASEQSQIVSQRFAETDARIDNDVFPLNSCCN